MKLKSTLGLLTALALLAVAVIGVTFSLRSATAQAAQPQPHATTTVVNVRTNKLGTFLVGPTGKTLYLWEKDTKNKTNCSGGCSQIWPALKLEGTLQAKGGVNSKLLGSIAIKGGRQVTYDGHPLYYYVEDSKPGDTTGQGSDSFGAKWYVLSTSGNAITK